MKKRAVSVGVVLGLMAFSQEADAGGCLSGTWSVIDNKTQSIFIYRSRTNYGSPPLIKVCVDGSTGDRKAKKTIDVLIEGKSGPSPNPRDPYSVGKINDYTGDDVPYCRYVQATQVWIKETEKGPKNSTGKFGLCF